jgi:hypothetical protein
VPRAFWESIANEVLINGTDLCNFAVLTAYTANSIAHLVVNVSLANDDGRQFCVAIALGAE